jgi:hypothetical protein
LQGHFGGTNVSLGQLCCQGGARTLAYRLILMGDRHDAVVATIEETGSTGATIQMQVQTLLSEKNRGAG